MLNVGERRLIFLIPHPVVRDQALHTKLLVLDMAGREELGDAAAYGGFKVES